MTRFDRAISSAVLARVLIGFQSLWLFLSGVLWPPHDVHPFDLDLPWLDFRVGFMVCIIGVVFAIRPSLHHVGIVWVCLVALATVTRFVSVVLAPPDSYGLGEQFRSLGWLFQTAFAIVLYTQVIAARALRRSWSA